ncbi:MAG: peptidoglycan-binding domain-containing protein [Candidatus Pacebacteria bacterium]|nr:peptidoglycan-binding domain-containing protein [Candidatus Paceibacterota bacterium]
MSLFKKTLILAISLIFAGSAFSVEASVTPTLSLSNTGSGDNVQITVNGDANASVLLYYTKTGSGPQLAYVGTTNSSGYMSVVVSTASLVVANSSAVHASVNGLNSTDVVWPYTTSTTSSITLNPTSSVLTVGGSSTVTATGSNSLYMLNNTNSQIVNVSISGNQITLTGVSYGSSVVTVCPVGTSTNCPSIYVMVQNSGASQLTFTQSNVSLAQSQSYPVTISGGTGVYTVLNNSNSSLVSTSLSGAIITLTAGTTTGSASITVCSSDISSCGIINVTIGSTSSSSLNFSQSNPTIPLGSNLTITVSGGGTSSYYVSSNSNSSKVSASLSGSSLTLYGIASGSSVINVCSSLGSCNSLTATVSYVSTGGALTLSQTSASLLVGQPLSITVSGGTSPYNLGTNAGNIFQATISGNILTLTGVSAGSSSIAVCSAEGACVNLSVTVGASSSTSISLSQNTTSLIIGQTASITITGNGGYYISGNTNSSIASATISGNIASVYGVSAGNTNISICQSGGQCAVIYATVTASGSTGSSAVNTILLKFSQASPAIAVGANSSILIAGGVMGSYYVPYNSSAAVATTSISGSILTVSGKAKGTTVIVVCDSSMNCGAIQATVGTAASTSSSTVNKFTRSLGIGDEGDDVEDLQERLKTDGYYSGPITGYFGSLTSAAVKKYQAANGIRQTGTMGPQTMASLNE